MQHDAPSDGHLDIEFRFRETAGNQKEPHLSFATRVHSRSHARESPGDRGGTALSRVTTGGIPQLPNARPRRCPGAAKSSAGDQVVTDRHEIAARQQRRQLTPDIGRGHKRQGIQKENVNPRDSVAVDAVTPRRRARVEHCDVETAIVETEREW